MNLKVANVPDTASTGVLLVMALAGLVVWKRGMTSPAASHSRF